MICHRWPAPALMGFHLYAPAGNLSVYLLVDMLLFCYMTNNFTFFFFRAFPVATMILPRGIAHLSYNEANDVQRLF